MYRIQVRSMDEWWGDNPNEGTHDFKNMRFSTEFEARERMREIIKMGKSMDYDFRIIKLYELWKLFEVIK